MIFELTLTHFAIVFVVLRNIYICTLLLLFLFFYILFKPIQHLRIFVIFASKKKDLSKEIESKTKNFEFRMCYNLVFFFKFIFCKNFSLLTNCIGGMRFVLCMSIYWNNALKKQANKQKNKENFVSTKTLKNYLRLYNSSYP